MGETGATPLTNHKRTAAKNRDTRLQRPARRMRRTKPDRELTSARTVTAVLLNVTLDLERANAAKTPLTCGAFIAIARTVGRSGTHGSFDQV